MQAVAKEAKHLESSLHNIRSGSIRTVASGHKKTNSMSSRVDKHEDTEDSGDEAMFFDCPSPGKF